MAVGPTIDNTLGVFFAMVVITSALYGAGMLQGWFYFRKYKNTDRWPTQTLVGFVLLCDTIQQTLVCEAIYRYLVTMHDDPLAAIRMEKTLMVELLFGANLAFAVQTFYCWRIFSVSRNYIIPSFIWLVCLVTLAITYVYGAIGFQYDSLLDLLNEEKLGSAGISLTAASDVLITLAIIFFLHTSKIDGGSRRHTDLLNRLIIFTFNTAIPTSVCGLISVVFLNALPNTYFYMGVYKVMDRFYTNCLLVTLNSRKYILNPNGSKLESISLRSSWLASNSHQESMKAHGISIHHANSSNNSTETAYSPDKPRSEITV